ncbi:DUF7289 family protein [Halorussus halophilus]|uniref:DUF7289 family protein n=1 Tax=Halorussus halophilus TaxID=2650975 RepID=UPI001300F595|nr:hypothetical protein [Halorussus halophilus]
MTIPTWLRSERAATETIGFVFAFALVTASVGVVYTTGIGGLEDARDHEQLKNAGRAFDVLADNVEDVRREGAPSRATELKLSDSSVRFGDPVRIEVQVNNTDTDANATYGMSARPLVYEGSAGRVVYSAGATFRIDDGYATMQTDPGYVVGDRRSHVPLLITYPRESGSAIRGSSTILIVAYRQSLGLDGRFETGTDASDPNARVNVTVESPRAAAWGRYFESLGMSPPPSDPSVADPDDGVVTYQFFTDRLTVSETAVEFDLQQ